MITIERKEITTVYFIKSIEILEGSIFMKDRYANFPVRLYDENGGFIGMQSVDVRDEEYDAWTTDDYIETLVLSKLGMTKAEEVPVVEEPVAEEPVVDPAADPAITGSTPSATIPGEI